MIETKGAATRCSPRSSLLRECGAARDGPGSARGLGCRDAPAAGRRDLRRQVAERLRAARIPLRELARQVFSLEELFLRITAQAAQRTGDTLSSAGPNVPGASAPAPEPATAAGTKAVAP